ncbi:hypothetical protein CDG81_00255 [Actinopolyspora erythraea]|uniref:Uncharacterized protein n=1 Tax=Actinopolyspora erythraea TaxID=414996 RepID=A0A099DBB6_9ACTN|nr:hypothetical protein CDG81_00255 [Actinopolyspora erythraea]KGI83012.1 hypothetical protein IL38_01405 [Actinopolyspora erythraea]
MSGTGLRGLRAPVASQLPGSRRRREHAAPEAWRDEEHGGAARGTDADRSTEARPGTALALRQLDPK